MVKKKNSKKSSKMQLRDEVGDDDSNPITVPDNTVDDYLPPDLEETRMKLSIPKPRHTYDLRDVFINYGGKWGKISPTGWVENDYKGGKSFKFGILYGEGINYGKFVRDIADKVNDHHGVGNYIPEGNVIELMCLYNGLPFIVRSIDDLREMWAQGDESYPMRTHVYIKPTDVVREIVDEAGEYVLLEEYEIYYIISPRETKKKNTTPVKATPIKKDAKRKGKAVAANKPAKRQKNVELLDSEELDALPEVYQSDKEINPEEITNYGIETPLNMVAESESECDDIDEEKERWVRYAQVGIDCLGAEDGYYNTHSSDDEDYVPTAEELERGDDFEGVDVELADIYSKEEDGRVKTPLEVGFKQLEVGMQWATVYEAREHMRRFGIVNHFTYISIKNDLTRLRFKCSEENCEWLVFISRNNDGHTMVLRHGNFQHSCEGRLGAENTLSNAPWVAREVEALVKNVRAMTPKAIKIRIKIKFSVEISYWTAWNARQICMESIVGSYDQGYNELPSLCVEILKSNPGSIARTWRQDDTLQWTGTLVAFRVSLNGFVKGCRPILGHDGCFLKGIMKGFAYLYLVLMSTMAYSQLECTYAELNVKTVGLIFLLRTKAESWDQCGLLPRAVKYLEYLMAHYGEYEMEGGDKNEWVSISSTGARWVLNLEERTCQCIEWQLTGMPCIHATSVLIPRRQALKSYFSPYHFAASYVATYSGILHPVYDETHWGSPPYVVDPPPLQRGRGRPRKERIRDDEVNKVKKKCGTFGHNKKTCKAGGRGSSGRASNAGRERGRSASAPITGKVQITPIAGGRGNSRRASNAGRGRGRSASIPIVGQVQIRSRKAFNTGGVQTRSGKSSNVGRGWGSSEGAVKAPQSQERPSLVIPPMPPRTDAPAKPYKKAFKPPRQNWRL
ncbi:hypothetical protein GIB67_013020 [Kingdonia uniflora]|uniref:SWIM-type domain-containing protein n=1 Tax=Kingdonia uniflora TaxID=39325 RepID=A0A7J7MCE8_9MAGN|nr:hypothetical protein GIB67_013020 [Kingdonia uniflora]